MTCLPHDAFLKPVGDLNHRVIHHYLVQSLDQTEFPHGDAIIDAHRQVQQELKGIYHEVVVVIDLQVLSSLV